MNVERAGSVSDFLAGDLFIADLSAGRDWRAAGNRPLDQVTLYASRQRYAHVLASCDVDGWSARRGTAAGAVLGAALGALAERMSDFSSGEIDAFASAIVDMTASAVQSSGSPLKNVGNLDAVAFANVRRFIELHILSSALTPDLIAGNFGMSRAVLYRLFEPVGGVASYIRSQRMSLALHELSGARSSSDRIGALAQRLGYNSVSAFARAFRETYGVSPGRLPWGMNTRSAKGDRLVDWLAPLCGRRPEIGSL